jgi:hypothetical protein
MDKIDSRQKVHETKIFSTKIFYVSQLVERYHMSYAMNMEGLISDNFCKFGNNEISKVFNYTFY